MRKQQHELLQQKGIKANPNTFHWNDYLEIYEKLSDIEVCFCQYIIYQEKTAGDMDEWQKLYLQFKFTIVTFI